MRSPILRRLAAITVAVAAIAVVPSVGNAVSTPNADAPTEASRARATVRNVTNEVLGVVTIARTRDGKLALAGRLSGLAPGFHGFHIHQFGVCDPDATDPAGNPTPFSTAGGHLNPAGVPHGQHAGDLPVLFVSRDGSARAAFDTDSASLAQILDADGSAFIVHAAADNYANIPSRYTSSTTGQPGPDDATLATGDSGGRVACGVIAAA
jgi:superoxide dismutase, Cu-Zn family